jgi:hypothetical protein
MPAQASQYAGIHGSSNTVVQIIGSENVVTIAGATAALRLHEFLGPGLCEQRHRACGPACVRKVLERRMDVAGNLSLRPRGFNSLPAKVQPTSRKRALHGRRQRRS